MVYFDVWFVGWFYLKKYFITQIPFLDKTDWTEVAICLFI